MRSRSIPSNSAPWARRSRAPSHATYKWDRQSFLNQDHAHVPTVSFQCSATSSVIARLCCLRSRWARTGHKFKIKVVGAHKPAAMFVRAIMLATRARDKPAGRAPWRPQPRRPSASRNRAVAARLGDLSSVILGGGGYAPQFFGANPSSRRARRDQPRRDTRRWSSPLPTERSPVRQASTRR
jgi:hypothetical protein